MNTGLGESLPLPAGTASSTHPASSENGRGLDGSNVVGSMAETADRVVSPVLSSPGDEASCGDLNLMPPPRERRTDIAALVGSGAAKVGFSGAILMVMLMMPVLAVVFSTKVGPWHSGKDNPSPYLCNDSVCHLEAHYFDEKLDENVDPCEDYYGHVCSSVWERLSVDLRTVPYLRQSPGFLYDGLRVFASAYQHQDVDQVRQSKHHFGHKILLFIASCVQPASRSLRETDSLGSVLKYLGLEGWPYDSTPRGRRDVAQIAGKVAGALALFPLVRTTLESLPPSGPKQPPELLLVLGQPTLPLERHRHLDESRAMDWYRDLVARAVRLFYAGKDHESIVGAIVGLERQLAQSLESMPSRKRLPLFKMSLSSIPSGDRWDWVAFANAVLKGSAALSSSQRVAVRSMLFLQRLARITHGAAPAVLLNYLGYRVLLAMSPLLPTSAEFLVPLSVEGRRIAGLERVQACVQLVEKVFGSALTVVLRHANPSLHHPDTLHKLSGLVARAKRSTRRYIKQASWLSGEDLNLTLNHVSGASVALLSPDDSLSEEDMGQYFVDVPMLNERSLLESYFHMKTSVQRKYWAALQRTQNSAPAAAMNASDIDVAARLRELGSVSSMDTSYKYDPTSNRVFLPYGVMGFLLHVKDVLPIHVPRFLHYAVRGLFAAVTDLQATHDDVRRPSWSRATALRFAHRSWCFLRQYTEALSAEADSSVSVDDYLDEAVEDNAVLEPLYRVYLHSFPYRAGRPAMFMLPTLKSMSSDQLFFVNYAVGHCENARNGTASKQVLFRERIPAKFKVNLPLSNFKRFAAVYKCKKGSRMNPARTCSVWND
ncbi:neprilysin-1-like isoform X1 [Ixodes scapularis]|uniref:neprilysin-1-like isoform X1 n=1 Tax=Ixodes scapularis TaxID=6945 RepID=UPI001C386A55|nr:neprilysin-1-like isoform X1 [Ixodes scapularis]